MYVSSYHLLLGDEVVELLGSGSLSHADGLFAITLYLKQTYKIGNLKLLRYHYVVDAKKPVYNVMIYEQVGQMSHLFIR